MSLFGHLKKKTKNKNSASAKLMFSYKTKSIKTFWEFNIQIIHVFQEKKIVAGINTVKYKTKRNIIRFISAYIKCWVADSMTYQTLFQFSNLEFCVGYPEFTTC